MSAEPDLQWATRNAASAAEWLRQAAGTWASRTEAAARAFEAAEYEDARDPDWTPEDGDELELMVTYGELARLVGGLLEVSRLLRACAEVVPEMADRPGGAGGAGTDARVAQIGAGDAT
jgi:hypothetical protein